MSLNHALIKELPKVELHLHLDGSLSPGRKIGNNHKNTWNVIFIVCHCPILHQQLATSRGTGMATCVHRSSDRDFLFKLPPKALVIKRENTARRSPRQVTTHICEGVPVVLNSRNTVVNDVIYWQGRAIPPGHSLQWKDKGHWRDIGKGETTQNVNLAPWLAAGV